MHTLSRVLVNHPRLCKVSDILTYANKIFVSSLTLTLTLQAAIRDYELSKWSNTLEIFYFRFFEAHVIYVLFNNILSIWKSPELTFLISTLNWNPLQSEKISSVYFSERFFFLFCMHHEELCCSRTRAMFLIFIVFIIFFANVAMNGNGNYTPLRVYHNGMGKKGQFRYWEVICTNEWRILGITLQQWFHDATCKSYQPMKCRYVFSCILRCIAFIINLLI